MKKLYDYLTPAEQVKIDTIRGKIKFATTIRECDLLGEQITLILERIEIRKQYEEIIEALKKPTTQKIEGLGTITRFGKS